MKSRAYRPIMLFLVALCCGGISQAQDPETGLYRSFFGEDSTVWNVYGWYVDDAYFNETYVIAGDTIVDDTMMCKNVYFKDRGYQRLDDGTWFSFDRLFWRGIIREDRTFGRLWYKSQRDSWDLIADMSLEIGDTFYLPASARIVKDIIIDSLNRKIILFRNGNPFIEGVGPIDFDVRVPYRFYYTLVCVKHDDVSQYSMELPNDIYATWLNNYYATGNCALYRTVGLSKAIDNAINIYPNPCEDWINVGCDGGVFSILDSYGRTILTKCETNESIDMRNVPKGVYFIRVEYAQQIFVKKIVKL